MLAKVEDVSLQALKHHLGYVMVERVPLHRLAQIMGNDSRDTTMVYVRGHPGRPAAGGRGDRLVVRSMTRARALSGRKSRDLMAVLATALSALVAPMGTLPRNL
ncbi:MAG TPA: hypothetical protein VE225_09505 [Rubrobacteraceae bacterium]|nr:hypothetical protein [Rubrobacteraceae bacterium]